jgi:hypothetical protein
MATESAALPGVPVSGGVHVVDKGLKKNAIGYLSNVVIGVASTAPAYSLARGSRRTRQRFCWRRSSPCCSSRSATAT